MKWTALPRGTPRWLERHPVLLADWLAACNALRRSTANRRRSLMVVAAALLGVTALAAAAPLASRAANLVGTLCAYWVATFVVCAMYAAVSVSRRRRSSRQQFAGSWLVAAPMGHRSLAVSHAVRSLLPLLLQSAGAMLLIAVLARLSAAPSGIARRVEACVGAGAICGALVGWWLLRFREHEHAVGSRYVLRARTGAQLRPSDAGLAGWPLAQVMAWSRPENSRVLLLAALFAVQGGSSALHGLAVVASWFAASYLSALLSASVRATREAAAWLRSTPMPFLRFAWSISRCSLLHQFAGSIVAVGLFVAVGSSWAMALYLAGLWMAIVVLVSTIALAECYRGRAPTISIAVSLAALAAIESRARGWSIPCAALMTAWHLRRAARS
jgi:hypothetical protein